MSIPAAASADSSLQVRSPQTKPPAIEKSSWSPGFIAIKVAAPASETTPFTTLPDTSSVSSPKTINTDPSEIARRSFEGNTQQTRSPTSKEEEAEIPAENNFTVPPNLVPPKVRQRKKAFFKRDWVDTAPALPSPSEKKVKTVRRSISADDFESHKIHSLRHRVWSLIGIRSFEKLREETDSKENLQLTISPKKGPLTRAMTAPEGM